MALHAMLVQLASNPTTTVGFDDIKSILQAVTAQFSTSNIVSMIAGILGVTVSFVFLWWGARKGFKAIVGAATRGKPRI